jgi:hypothetical protein
MLEHLARVSRVCQNCKWPIVPGDLICYGDLPISADFSSVGDGPFIVCTECGSGNQTIGHWSERGLVLKDQRSAPS